MFKKHHEIVVLFLYAAHAIFFIYLHRYCNVDQNYIVFLVIKLFILKKICHLVKKYMIELFSRSKFFT